jgi:hypothetical protein
MLRAAASSDQTSLIFADKYSAPDFGRSVYAHIRLIYVDAGVIVCVLIAQANRDEVLYIMMLWRFVASLIIDRWLMMHPFLLLDFAYL